MLEFDNAGLTMTVSIPADDALQLFIDLGRVLARMEQGETSPAE
ncbi:hypothetical protein [Rhodoligotrophos defluvii]|nr:hypothetical protein [Rhodoligotrophos defluvii]